MPSLDAATRARLIEEIAALPSRLEELVAGLTDEQLLGHFLDGEWNVAQNVHHLADSHINSFIRLKLLLTEDRPTVRPYDQDRWAVTAEADNPRIEDSLEVLRGLHRRWAALFASLDEAQWARRGYHPENGEISVEGLLADYAAHGDAHIDQIQRTLAAGGFAHASRGVWSARR